jgi:hypothetical protein
VTRPAVAAARPLTLGDVLNDTMGRRVQTTDDAARTMGVTSAEVLAWSTDEEPPAQRDLAALTDYLQIDEAQLRGLVLRGQMRRVQERIHN